MDEVIAHVEVENHAAVTFVGGGSGSEDDKIILEGSHVNVSVGDDGRYSIGAVLDGNEGSWDCTLRTPHQTVSGNTPDKCGLIFVRPMVIPVVNGTIDPNMPGKISGSKTFQYPDRGILQWDLHYCSDVTRSCSKN